MKVGKEDMVGILSAVELYLAEDHEATDRFHEEVVAFVIAWGTGRDDIEVTREFPSEAGQPMPRARITLRGDLATQRDAVMTDLLCGLPRIAVWPGGDDGIYVNPQTMRAGEEQAIVRLLEEILAARGTAAIVARESGA